MNMQKTAPEDFQRQIFQELKELEEQKTKEALELAQRKHKLIKWEDERERARAPAKIGVVNGSRSVDPEATTIPPLVRAHPPWPFDTDEAMSASSQMVERSR